MEGFDSYFNVPLGIDIQSISDRDINELLQNMSRSEQNSDLLKRSIHFFIEYYNKSVFELMNMGFDELFPPGLLKDKNGAEISAFDKEMGLSLEKIRVEFDRYLVSNYQMHIKDLLEDETYKDRFTDIFSNFFRNRCTQIVGTHLDVDNNLILNNIANYLYQYVNLKKGDDEAKNRLFSSINNFDAQVLAKHNRLLNLEAKLAHTSRMVFMTIYHTLDIKDPKLRELAVLAVMYHDIGRIYQALYYPSFDDSYVKYGELSGNYSLLESHAEVGYYFPMQNLIVQDLIRCNGNMDETFVMHTLMSVVIKYHGKPNSDISHYDVTYGDVSLTPELITELEKTLIEVFKKSPEIPIRARYDTLSNINHMKEFHSDIASYIIECIKLVSEIKKKSASLDEATVKKINSLDNYLRHYYPSSVLEGLYENPERLEDLTVLEQLFGVRPPEDFKVKSSNLGQSINDRLENISNKILSVDFATTLNDVVAGKETSVEITPEMHSVLRKVIGAIMTITTDMDKLDIFNQRINGSWEKTNKSRYDRDTTEGELSREEVIDSVSRDTFFSNVGEEPNNPNGLKRGIAILRGGTKGNSIKAIWFHLDQFITVNLRNYSSFELFANGSYLEKLRQHMIEEQHEEYREVLIPLIDEAITFTEQFLDFVLHVRVDSEGKYVYPLFDSNTGLYQEVEGLSKPVLFNASEMAAMRRVVMSNFKQFYQYVGNEPEPGNYPVPRFVEESFGHTF